MVWGMHLPQGGGPCGPDGAEEGVGSGSNLKVGWYDRLRAHYEAQDPETQKSLNSDARTYPFRVVEKFVYEIGRPRPGGGGSLVQPILSHEPPRYFKCSKGYAQLAAIISLQNGMWAVDETVKTIIEEFDPGIHQFQPLEMRMPRDQAYPTNYYTFVAGRWLESFALDQCGPNSVLDRSVPGFPFYSISHHAESITGLAFRRSGFEEAHCWRERGLNENLLCFSDGVMERLAASGTVLPKHYRMKEV